MFTSIFFYNLFNNPTFLNVSAQKRHIEAHQKRHTTKARKENIFKKLTRRSNFNSKVPSKP